MVEWRFAGGAATTQSALGRAGGLLRIAAACLAISGCGASQLPEVDPLRHAARAPSVAWVPRAPDEQSVPLPGEQPPAVPPELQPPAARLDLAALVDLALRQSPSTRDTWQRARAAAAAYGAARGAYYPTLSTELAQNWVQTGVSEGLGEYQGRSGTFAASADYLLLDFGGRGASVEAARQALLAANWTQNQSIQDVLLGVAQAYYVYLGRQALVRAAETTLADATTSRVAAQQRLDYGAGTIADVYQAQADEARARYVLVGARGQVETARGVLATAVGWPANAAFEVDAAPPPAPERLAAGVEQLIAAAQRDRPALAAARAAVLEQQQALRRAESARWPTLSAAGWIEREFVHFNGGPPMNTGQDIANDNYQAGLVLSAPLFEGFALRNAVTGARATLAASRAQLERREQEVIDDVWAAYFTFVTAQQQLMASRALVASAAQSYDVSLERYRLGAGDVVQLLNTLATLAGARAILVESETGLAISYAQLLHATGAAVPTAFGGGAGSALAD